jgi:NADH-quinone oxidoreductase subunit J
MEPLFVIFFKYLAVFASFLAVTAPNAVQAVLALIIVFGAIACLVLLMGVEFIALVFILVYVGAIAILFLFVVMMLNVKEVSTRSVFSTLGYFTFLFIGVLLIHRASSLLQFSAKIYNTEFYLDWLQALGAQSSLHALSMVLFSPTGCILLLLVGGILLIALFGAVVLTFKEDKLD